MERANAYWKVASGEEELAHSEASDSRRDGAGVERDNFSSRLAFISRCCCLDVLIVLLVLIQEKGRKGEKRRKRSARPIPLSQFASSIF